MTKAEARQIIADWLAVSEGEKGQCGYIKGWFYEKDVEAFHMAIEALEQEPIIHCKNCKYWHEWENGTGSCHRSDIMWMGSDYDDYCSFGNRKESEE